MDNTPLTPAPFLGGYARDFADTNLREETSLGLISIAQPLGGHGALQSGVRALWGCALPTPGQSAMSKDASARLLCLGSDSFFAILHSDDQLDTMRKALIGAGYSTDQSDNWVALRLSGPRALAALERICPIDLHASVFATGSFARTSMEHLGVIILRDAADSFLLLSASSSAASFLHSVETSLEYVS